MVKNTLLYQPISAVKYLCVLGFWCHQCYMVYFSTVLTQASEPVYTNLQAEQLSSALLLTAHTAAHSKHVLEFHLGVRGCSPLWAFTVCASTHSHRAPIWFCTQKCICNYLPSTACYCPLRFSVLINATSHSSTTRFARSCRFSASAHHPR